MDGWIHEEGKLKTERETQEQCGQEIKEAPIASSRHQITRRGHAIVNGTSTNREAAESVRSYTGKAHGDCKERQSRSRGRPTHVHSEFGFAVSRSGSGGHPPPYRLAGRTDPWCGPYRVGRGSRSSPLRSRRGNRKERSKKKKGGRGSVSQSVGYHKKRIQSA